MRRRLSDDEIWQRFKDGECDRAGNRIPTEEELRVEAEAEIDRDERFWRWVREELTEGLAPADRATRSIE